MSNEYEVIAEGYLYNLWNGKLKEYRGEVLHKEKYEDSYGRYISPEVNYFMVHDEHNRIVKKLCCSAVEGEICNKGLWLSESNKSKAAEILIQYEEEQIAKLKFQIENHEELIESLRKEMKES